MQITDVSSKIATGAAGGDRLKVAGMRFHFIGAGGIGMSGLAEVLINLGYEVTGSDIRESKLTQRLRELGCKIVHGHHPQNVQGADVVVVSSAIKGDNPELLAARERAIPVIPRAEMLAGPPTDIPADES